MLYYSLIKMVYYMCHKSDTAPTWPMLEHAIKRNFGGLEGKDWSPFEEFERQIHINRTLPDLSGIPDEVI